MIALIAFAAQLAIVAHAPDTASACQAIEISVAVSTHGRYVPQLVVPSLGPFDVLRSSPVPHVTYDGRGGLVAEYEYVLTTERTGRFTIPPFEARLGPAIARSRSLTIVMRPPGPDGAIPTVVARARADTSLEVNFRALTLPETVYVGQQANYEVAVFLNRVVRDRLRRNPTFFPPDMQSMLAYDLPSASEPPRRPLGSRCFDALVYQRALFPLMPGRFAIPPADLVYSLPLTSSFFSREETHEIQTDSTIIVAIDPPLAGRPADFGGAVGDLRVAARLDTNASRVGDPLVLTVRVSGTGNVKLFPRPVVGIPWGALVTGDERVDVDTTARKIAGSKEFDWVLTPRIAGELDVPPIHYSFFNPDRRRYETASTKPTRVHVAPGTLASSDTARSLTLLALRTRYRGVPATPLHQHPVFWALLALAPLPAVTLRRRDHRASTRHPVSSADRLTMLARGATVAADACQVRRAYTRALADRLSLSIDAFTRPGALARALRRRGVSTELAASAERFLRQLDEAAFAEAGALPGRAAQRALELYRAIDADALPRTHIAGPILGVIVLLAAAGVTAHAYEVSVAQRAFDRGVLSYEHHDFASARDAFAASALAEPRAPDAWANLGTAAWAVSDTARSVAAWQRALRLQPLAADVRERAELVHALPMGAAGYVPPLPASWLFDLAALIWLVAWGAAAWRARAHAPIRAGELGVVSALAVLFVIGGFTLSDRLAGRRLAVVRQMSSLRADPDLGGDRRSTAIIGEVVRVTGRDGAWSRVRLDDGGDGWIANANLISLDERDATQIGAQ